MNSLTNYGIAELVYGSLPGAGGRDLSYEFPDFQEVARMMDTRKNMTLVFLWNRYKKRCLDEEKKFYQYRQFCDLYAKWCEENYETFHFTAVIGQKMEVDFAGQTFKMIDRLNGEIDTIVVFVAVLPYSQFIYAEGMVSTKEPQWIEVNNNALRYFGGVPALVVCDNCKQAVLVNKDWIEPELNKDYAEWAEHNHTAILPAKVRKPKFKSSVENAVGIQALSLNKATYTFIKNSIPVVAEDMGTSGYNTKINEERNQGGFIMSSEAMDINNLLSRSQELTRKCGKEDEE